MNFFKKVISTIEAENAALFCTFYSLYYFIVRLTKQPFSNKVSLYLAKKTTVFSERNAIKSNKSVVKHCKQ